MPTKKQRFGNTPLPHSPSADWCFGLEGKPCREDRLTKVRMAFWTLRKQKDIFFSSYALEIEASYLIRAPIVLWIIFKIGLKHIIIAQANSNGKTLHQGRRFGEEISAVYVPKMWGKTELKHKFSTIQAWWKAKKRGLDVYSPFQRQQWIPPLKKYPLRKS